MRFDEAIRALAARFNLSVTSWFRSRLRNLEVGGSANSMHLMGLAVDVVLDANESQQAFVETCRRLDLEVIAEKDHLHVQHRHPAKTVQSES